MTALQNELAKIINRFSPDDGLHTSPLPGVHTIKFSSNDRLAKRRWRASFSIIAQGGKEILLGKDTYRCEAAQFIATPIDLAVTSRIYGATPEKPFLCLKIDFDWLTLSEIAAQLEKGGVKAVENPLRAMFVGKADDTMLEALLRLAKLFQIPQDATVLGPLVIKEILYHLLKGPSGPAIRQFIYSGNKMHKITQAIYALRADLTEEVDVRSLAKAANMSRSAFFQHFKEATSMSPIQFQKRLRLLEAQRLLREEMQTAEGAAFQVGYNSASQFSREYSRLFGNSPLRDAVKMKKSELTPRVFQNEFA
ncbi:MAG TPA: AraC family transcriptional regulator [bacterium]|jgi:AraC-like DNA-binding protein|nr:AraC family transcriptional regulator [bacterium]